MRHLLNPLDFSVEEIDQLLDLENPYACPHGRPIVVETTRYALEKRFKRLCFMSQAPVHA